MPQKIRVLVASSDSALRARLFESLVLEPQVEIVGETTSLDDTVQRLRESPPEVLLVDGIRVQSIRNRVPHSQARLVVFVPADDLRLCADSLKWGASSLVLRSAPRERVFEAIQSVCAGGIYIDPDIPGIRAGRQQDWRGPDPLGPVQ